jgi:hypothetical protein
MTEMKDCYSLQQNHRRSRARGAAMVQAVERRARRRQDHTAVTSYRGINVVMLWSAAVTKGYACPIWLTFQTSPRASTATYGKARAASSSFMRAASRAPRPTTKARSRSARSRSSKATPFSTPSSATAYRRSTREGRAPCPRAARAHHPRRAVLCGDRRRDPPWRHPRLSRRRAGLCADAAFRDLPGCRELRRDACARTHPLDVGRSGANVRCVLAEPQHSPGYPDGGLAIRQVTSAPSRSG